MLGLYVMTPKAGGLLVKTMRVFGGEILNRAAPCQGSAQVGMTLEVKGKGLGHQGTLLKNSHVFW